MAGTGKFDVLKDLAAIVPRFPKELQICQHDVLPSVAIHVPAEVVTESLLQYIRGRRLIHHDMVFETVSADIPQKTLEVLDVRYLPPAEE